jgi:F420-non-reducing hydrogenase small subunit
MRKTKMAFYWCSTCGGCDASVLDLTADFASFAAELEIVFWPMVMDGKYDYLEALPDSSIAVTLINGAIRTDSQERKAKLLRRKSRIVMAHGSCAHLGGAPGLANFYTVKDLLNRSFVESSSIADIEHTVSAQCISAVGSDLPRPRLTSRLKALGEVVEVDYYIPGCPPPPDIVMQALILAMNRRLPGKGTVLAPAEPLCASCPRRNTMPDHYRIKKFKTLHEGAWDSGICFMGQGYICLGPATRGGCEARCIRGNMPCRGCFGPTDEVKDQGARMLSCLAAFMDSTEADEMERISAAIPDLAGLLYRYCAATSLLRGMRRES